MDPLSDDHPGESPYVYCSNNPLNVVDDDGMEGEVKVVIGPDGVKTYQTDDQIVHPDDHDAMSFAELAGLTMVAALDPDPITKTAILVGVSIAAAEKISDMIDNYRKNHSDLPADVTNTTYPTTDKLPTYTLNQKNNDNGGKHKKQTRKSEKDKASDIPSWAEGEKPRPGENGKAFAKRLCDNRFGKNAYPTRGSCDYQQLKKNGDRRSK
jgi:hypothetical protein